jgi:hypothetical protein
MNARTTSADELDTVDPATGEVTAFTLPKNESQRALTFAEALAEAAAHGAETSSITILDPYEKVNKEKNVLLDRPLLVRAVKFMVDRATGNEYANFWVIRDDDRLFRVTDGGSGMYRQIGELVEERLAAGHPTPYNYFLFPNGLQKSEYLLDAAGNITEDEGEATAKGATYYFAY